MNLPEKPPTHFYLQTSNTPQSEPRPKWRSANGILRVATLAAVTGILLCSPIGSPVLAKAARQADAPPTIDPSAIEALNKMITYLHSLKAFQVQADVSNDDVLDDGQIIENISKVDLLASRPNRLRVEVTSDERHRLFLYDGKNFTVWGMLVNYYATVPAPPTIGELIDQIDDKYDIELPLVDLFRWGTNEDDAKKITAAVDAGPSTVGGVTCEQYAFRQEGVDWQVWIQLGEFPLPRKLVIRTLSDDARPAHRDTLTWNLAPSFDNESFVFDPPQDAKRIVLAERKIDDAGKGK
jgi:hypothetical protein